MSIIFQDMRKLFSGLPGEVKTELITHHLSSLQSELLSKYLENIPQEVTETALNLHNSRPCYRY